MQRSTFRTRGEPYISGNGRHNVKKQLQGLADLLKALRRQARLQRDPQTIRYRQKVLSEAFEGHRSASNHPRTCSKSSSAKQIMSIRLRTLSSMLLMLASDV